MTSRSDILDTSDREGHDGRIAVPGSSRVWRPGYLHEGNAPTVDGRYTQDFGYEGWDMYNDPDPTARRGNGTVLGG